MIRIQALLLVFWLPSSVNAQQAVGENVNVNTLDPAYVTFPDDGIDYPGCFQDLAGADRNGDGLVRVNEYLSFVQTYGKRICHYTDRLTLQQRSAFNALACRCKSQEGSNPNCCLGPMAKIKTNGATVPRPSQEELTYLTEVCRITDGTIGEPRGCPPLVIDPEGPPPFNYVPGPAVAAVPPPVGGGLSKGALAGIIVGAILGALLLLLCCCCCVGRRRKKPEEEEEIITKEEITDVEKANGVPPPPVTARAPPPMDEPPVPVPESEEIIEQEYVESVPPPPPVPVPIPATVPPVPPPSEDEEEVREATGSANIDDEYEDEDVRVSRGAAKIPPEEDDPKRRIRGAGEIPDPQEDPEKVKLRPIEKEDEEDPEWDFPGQAIAFPKEKDDMSAGEVEHYEPDGGVYIPERPTKDPLEWDRKWEKPEEDDPDEVDTRKHRIQAGLGEGEVWNKLDEGEGPSDNSFKPAGGDVFDWVVQSALGVLNDSEQAGHLDRTSEHSRAAEAARGRHHASMLQQQQAPPTPPPAVDPSTMYETYEDVRNAARNRAPAPAPSYVPAPVPSHVPAPAPSYVPAAPAYAAAPAPPPPPPPYVQDSPPPYMPASPPPAAPPAAATSSGMTAENTELDALEAEKRRLAELLSAMGGGSGHSSGAAMAPSPAPTQTRTKSERAVEDMVLPTYEEQMRAAVQRDRPGQINTGAEPGASSMADRMKAFGS